MAAFWNTIPVLLLPALWIAPVSLQDYPKYRPAKTDYGRVIAVWDYEGPWPTTIPAGLKLVAADIELPPPPGERFDLDDIDIFDADSGESFGSDPAIQRLTLEGEFVSEDDPAVKDQLAYRGVFVWAVRRNVRRVNFGYWGDMLFKEPVALQPRGRLLPPTPSLEVVALGPNGSAPGYARHLAVLRARNWPRTGTPEDYTLYASGPKPDGDLRVGCLAGRRCRPAARRSAPRCPPVPRAGALVPGRVLVPSRRLARSAQPVRNAHAPAPLGASRGGARGIEAVGRRPEEPDRPAQDAAVGASPPPGRRHVGGETVPDTLAGGWEMHMGQTARAEGVVAAWRTTNNATVFLVENLPPAIWTRQVPGVPRLTVGMIAAHLHNTRCRWIKSLGAPHGLKVPRLVDLRRVRPAELVKALSRSSEGMVELIELGLANGGRVPPATWQNFPTDMEHFLSYFAAHEGHHRGQLCMVARQLGHRLPPDVRNGIWQWTRLSRGQAPFGRPPRRPPQR